MKAAVTCALLVFGISAFADDVGTWTANYDKMIQLLQVTPKIGDCSLSLTSDGSANSIDLNLVVGQKPLGFTMTSPAGTAGETRTDFSQNQFHYASEDFVGWENLYVEVSASGEAVGLRLNKSLPNGTVYSIGAECGTLSSLVFKLAEVR